MVVPLKPDQKSHVRSLRVYAKMQLLDVRLPSFCVVSYSASSNGIKLDLAERHWYQASASSFMRGKYIYLR